MSLAHDAIVLVYNCKRHCCCDAITAQSQHVLTCEMQQGQGLPGCS